jgi:hypothetical protein
MSNICSMMVTITGKKTEPTGAMDWLDGLVVPGCDGNALDFTQPNSSTHILVLDNGIALSGDQSTFAGNCKWCPPREALIGLSKEFSGLDIKRVRKK